MQQLDIDQGDLAEAGRLNGRLGRAPRFRVRNRVDALLIQSLLKLSQIGADRRMARSGVAVDDRRVTVGDAQVGLRVLRPAGALRGVVLDIHGGGWAIGNARMNDQLNLALIQACDVAVVSIEYRLAGPVPLQALQDDCLTGARWLLEGGLSGTGDLPVILIGESAGAHLAAATLLRLRQHPDLLRRVKGAVLYYGVYDLSGTPSVRAAGPDTLVLHGPSLWTRLRGLVPGPDDAARRRSPLSPLYGDLTGLPPALMVVGECDPLLDDTLEMAERWRESAEVELHRVPESPHGFIRFRTTIARKVLERTAGWINTRRAEGSGIRRT